MSVPPPRDAMLRDRDGRVWHYMHSIGEWVSLGEPSQESGRSYPWAELVATFGPLDVFVWRGTEWVAE